MFISILKKSQVTSCFQKSNRAPITFLRKSRTRLRHHQKRVMNGAKNIKPPPQQNQSTARPENLRLRLLQNQIFHHIPFYRKPPPPKLIQNRKREQTTQSHHNVIDNKKTYEVLFLSASSMSRCLSRRANFSRFLFLSASSMSRCLSRRANFSRFLIILRVSMSLFLLATSSL